MPWIRLVLALVGGITFVVALANTSFIGMGIGVVFAAVGMVGGGGKNGF
jgi:hypothetical protein